MRVVWCFPAEVRGGMGPACLPSGCSCCPRRPVKTHRLSAGGAGRNSGRAGGHGARPALPKPCARGGRGLPWTRGHSKPVWTLFLSVVARLCRAQVLAPIGVEAESAASALPGSPSLRAPDPLHAGLPAGALPVLPWRVPIRLDCRAALLRRGFLGPQILQDVCTHQKSWWGTRSVHLNPAESFLKGPLQSAA